ncbi:ectonucleoside triphosphate diphosphohydrolase 2-like [Platysternon megacephalum]|uniref:Ectonucleoside triphosphate diphosphohydrolase 2-like n=1 Tax=Platysternon megacephalum TaxID=55544 RepID=A0A4D9EPG9_9SAUR|nr:ectonucleoside triphosphate diphosphohydrolase 2-like [Platysternon megacephalum]
MAETPAAGGSSTSSGDAPCRGPAASEDSNVQDKKAASSSYPTSAASEQSPNNSAAKADHLPVLKVDDRQRLARIRREELEKQLAARESVWLEKEERARQHYEKHLEERKKKLEEQRLKEEKRRAAVEEKRKQRIEEDKERHEAVVRRTIERSQKPKQKQNRWSWGGPIHRSSSVNNTDPDRRSVSTMNLSKHVDPVINKRLSSSSATLLNSPDRARRLNLSPLEKSIVSRLLMPTHSFLARSKSTAALSGDAASCSPISPLSYKAMNCRNPADRPKFFDTTTGRRRTTHSAGTDKKEKDLSSSVKRLHSPSNPKTRSLALSPVWHASKSLPFLPGTPKQITSPPGSSKVPSSETRPPSPGNIRPIKKELKPDSQKKGPEKEPEKAAEEQTEEGKAISASAGESAIGEGLSVKLEPAQVAAPALPPAPPATSPSPVSSKASAGTTDPEEATRLLTEKRRLAREQREREEQERKEREETERRKKEALSQKIAEERARREEEEARRQEAERKQREGEQEREKEEELRRQAEERDQKEKEEMERIQKQKEEAARQSEEAERNRLEREKRSQREEQERLERKKRLEEIMRRTRRTEAVDKKSSEQQNGEISKANVTGETATSPTSPLESVVASQLQHVTESPHNGESVTHSQIVISHQPTVNMDSNLNPGKEPNENGVSMQNDNFEEIINLPIGSKPSTLDALNNDGSNSPEIPLNPILAFEDKGTLGPLPQVDGVQTHQTAEVI